MAEQETGQASSQAHQNRAQNEGQGSTSGSRGGARGGRRRGRGRGGRQRQDTSVQSSGGNANASADIAAATPSTAAPAAPSAPSSSGASRGRRNRRGNRGASRGQVEQSRGVFSMGPRRQFGGRLTTTEQSAETAAQDASLSANAAEFVPGQPVPQRSNRQQPTAEAQSGTQPRSRGNRTRNRKQDRPRQEVPKSTASELWQRIQEDIANWNYECRICTEEVTRKTEVWSCTTCWTVVHLECAHQWWDTSMKVNEESGDKSWRCPGCNSTLTEEPGNTTFVSSSVIAELARVVLKRFGKRLAATVARQFCIRPSHAVPVRLLAQTNVHEGPPAVILLWTTSVILTIPTFTTSRAIFSKYIAQRSAGKISAAGFIPAKSCAIDQENAETRETAASKFVERRSCSATILASFYAMAKHHAKNPRPVR
ncbi:hypothetical protein FGRMN_7376 [Fusarium graminum]|nr:hypothetical protein FGRMN_7376 [Fusarium graminum]